MKIKSSSTEGDVAQEVALTFLRAAQMISESMYTNCCRYCTTLYIRLLHWENNHVASKALELQHGLDLEH